MKTFYLAALLLIPSFAAALKPADGPSYLVIEELLRQSRSKETELLALNAQLRALRGSIARSPLSGADSDANDPDIRQKNDDIARVTEERDIIMSRAIKVTLRAYGIVPENNGVLQMPRGVSSHELNRGKTIEFVPVYNPALGQRHAAHSNRGPVPLDRPKPGDKAYTAFNGSAVLLQPVSGPRELAMILFHEKRHFEQFTSPELANLSHADKERLAFLDTLGVMGQVGYTVGSSEERAMKKFLDERFLEFTVAANYEKTLAGKVASGVDVVRRKLTGAPDPNQKSEFGIAEEDLALIQEDARRLDRSLAAADATRLRLLAFDYCSAAQPAMGESTAFLHSLTISASEELGMAAAFNPQQGDCLRMLGTEIDARRRQGIRITADDLLRLSAPHRPRAQLPPALPLPPEAPPAIGPSATTDALIDIVEKACRNEWPTPDHLLNFYRLSRTDVIYLSRVVAATPPGCAQSLLSRLVAMNRANDSISVSRLQTETAPFLPPPAAAEVPYEHEPREYRRPGDDRGPGYNPCIDPGNTCLRR